MHVAARDASNVLCHALHQSWVAFILVPEPEAAAALCMPQPAIAATAPTEKLPSSVCSQTMLCSSSYAYNVGTYANSMWRFRNRMPHALSKLISLLLECLGEKQLVSPQDWVFLLGSGCCEAAACWSMHCKAEDQAVHSEGMVLQARQPDMTRCWQMDMKRQSKHGMLL